MLVKKNNRQNKRTKAIDLQKVMGFKFQSLSKVYDNYRRKRETEKLKKDKTADDETMEVPQGILLN